jgi:hypothetical protein
VPAVEQFGFSFVCAERLLHTPGPSGQESAQGGISWNRPIQLGERQFTDGTTRPGIREDNGRQFVLDYDGKPA